MCSFGRPFEQAVGRAFGDRHVIAVAEQLARLVALDVVDGRHGLALAAEGQFGDARQLLLQFVARPADFLRGDQQRAFGRVADDFDLAVVVLFEIGVGRQRHRLEEAPDGLVLARIELALVCCRCAR